MSHPLRLLMMAVAMAGAMSTGDLPAAAQSQGPSGHAMEKARQHERAIERCRQNRGIDCSSPEGLKEWELLERSREEAVMQGSRNLRPVQTVVPKAVRPASP